MPSELTPLALAAGLFVTVAVGLGARKASTSLISLFYASLITGIAFTVYGDALVGLLTMITFAGAVSVLLLAVILLTGEADLSLGAARPALGLAIVTTAVAVASLAGVSGGPGGSAPEDVSSAVLAFAWSFRPWDLLILVVALSSAMVAVAHLLGREG